jgi:hypothetical protein
MRGGRAAAVVFSLAESCRIANVDPVDYFADVLVRVGIHPASRVDELLPENWARLFARSRASWWLKLRRRSSQLAPRRYAERRLRRTHTIGRGYHSKISAKADASSLVINGSGMAYWQPIRLGRGFG